MDVLTEAKSNPVSTLSVFSFIPPRRTEPKESRYFNCITKGYDMKLHRDDREHSKARGLDFYTEESSRPVPVLSSSVYGRFSAPVHHPERSFARVGQVRSDFYSKNGVTWTVEEGYGSVTPI
ncbi:hypothetical protein DNTS_026374 [Danionella cerebrum]|uniref:Uncharacterized protein n=1 Tax=Danionella cerebrum TaxID=2873325 RepID=A0A553N465_9TELE|nr:hypothetical protein DNTS_026374 [Danionella translucida]